MPDSIDMRSAAIRDAMYDEHILNRSEWRMGGIDNDYQSQLIEAGEAEEPGRRMERVPASEHFFAFFVL